MRGRRQNASAAQNIYSSATSQKGRRYGLLLSARSIILFVSCFAIIATYCTYSRRLLRLLSRQNRDDDDDALRSRHSNRCWLKHALKSGKFKLFSHRSYHDNTRPELQPTCHESLSQLKSIGVNHLDLDLVLDERRGSIDDESEQQHQQQRQRLVVAHPMEFKRQSDYYSPCANVGFDDMMHTLKIVYGNDFFVSMEPKAAWGRTRKEFDDVALTNVPSRILKELSDKIEEHELGGNCAVIVEINNKEVHQDDQEGELEMEKQWLEEILHHCQLFRGIRLLDDSPTSLGEYDIIMPTIEFHPSHAHNAAPGKVIPKSLRSKSVFWVVDNEADLDMAADMHPYGVVSNSPHNIVRIVEDPSWCDE